MSCAQILQCVTFREHIDKPMCVLMSVYICPRKDNYIKIGIVYLFLYIMHMKTPFIKKKNNFKIFTEKVTFL